MSSGVCGAEAVAGGAGVAQANPSAVAELGRRLLSAARAGDSRAVLELMSRGAPFTADWLGTSPLHLAAQHAHADTCAVLLRAGMSRDTRTKVERTPLHLAAYEGHAAVAELLLAYGALVDPRDMLLMTPLHWAAQRHHADVARLLLRHGADPRATSKFGKTPLDLAADPELRAALEAATLRSPTPRPSPALAHTHYTNDSREPRSPVLVSSPGPEPSPPSVTPRPSPKRQKSDSGREEGAALLRRHGITLLPDDDAGTVLTALQSGRTVVLSDAGKLMLKDSEATPAPAAPASLPTPRGGGGVLLTATPVTTPPRPGVKIFTLPHKLVTRRAPLTKVKYVQLPADAQIVSAGAGGARRHALLQLRSPAPAPGTPTPIKLLLQKNGPGRPPAPPAPSAHHQTTEAEVCRLRDELATARQTVCRLRARLRRARAARRPPSACTSPEPDPDPPD